MKKIIIGFSSLVVLIFLIIFAVNAQNNDKEVKKAQSEVSKDCSQNSTSACDPAKCASLECDKAKCKEGKCDPVKCKSNCKDASCEKKCEPVKCNSQKADKK